MSNQIQTPGKIKKSKLYYLFFIFFAVIFTVDFNYIYLAEKNWRGVATEDGYQKGLKYNQVIEYVKKQKELGWDSKINFTSQASKSGILEVSLTDKNKQILSDASINVKLTRPVQEGFDFQIPLKYNKKTSLYDAPITFPLKGQWNVEIQVIKGDKIYQNTKRFVIQ